MSIEVVSWVLREAPTTSPVQQMVLVGIANHADPDGTNAFPAVSTLAMYARTSERTVQRALRDLLEIGVICIQEDNEKRDAYIRRPDRRPVGYQVLMLTNTLRHPPTPTDAQRGDNLSPRSGGERGDTSGSNGVTPEVERGDTGVTRTVKEPSIEPSTTTTPPDGDAGRGLKPHTYDHDPAVCCLVARWYEGWASAHPDQRPDPSVTKRVAGQAKNVAKDRKTHDDWVRAAAAAFAAGEQGIYDIVQGIPVQRRSQFISDRVAEEKAIYGPGHQRVLDRLAARDAKILAERELIQSDLEQGLYEGMGRP